MSFITTNNTTGINPYRSVIYPSMGTSTGTAQITTNPQITFPETEAAATWPSSLQEVYEKYFDVKGDVVSHSKEFVDLISRLPGVDDNFKAVKLYDLLKKGKHQEFKAYANKCYGATCSKYSFSSDSNTGIYYGGSDTIKITTSGNSSPAYVGCDPTI